VTLSLTRRGTSLGLPSFGERCTLARAPCPPRAETRAPAVVSAVPLLRLWRAMPPASKRAKTGKGGKPEGPIIHNRCFSYGAAAPPVCALVRVRDIESLPP
jgi:hypothetical protein